jgi:hypothetical protein
VYALICGREKKDWRYGKTNRGLELGLCHRPCVGDQGVKPKFRPHDAKDIPLDGVCRCWYDGDIYGRWIYLGGLWIARIDLEK